MIVAPYRRLSQGLEPIAPRKHLLHTPNFLYMLHGRETRRKYSVTDVGQCNGVTCGEQSRRQTVEYRAILDDYVEWGSWRCGQPNNDDPTAMLARVSRTTGAKCHSR